MRTAFIGGGIMAEAMLSRAIAGGSLSASDVVVAEPVEARHAALAAYGARAVTANREAVEGAGLVVLAVKPQHVDHVFSDLAGNLDTGQTVLSILAGVPLARLTEGLQHRAVVRVMPNTPAQVGAGMSVWTATPDVSEEGRSAAAALLRALGKEWPVADESYIDMATAVSGSGPAYVFAFIESLVEAGVYLGMTRDMALTLSVQTVLGSAQLVSETGDDPGLLRQRVTSPGGTTAEALRALEQGGFKATLQEAIIAAHQRARELGGNA